MTTEAEKKIARREALSKSIRFEVFKRDSFKCQYCGGEAPNVLLHVDHIEPVSKGGTNDITNLITSGERIAELEARLADVAHAYDVTFKRRTELELAILPFAEFAEHVDENGWTSEIHREPISTWFGPSDFRAAGKVKA